MDSTIKRILGERVGELEKPEEIEAPQTRPDLEAGPEDTEVEELASLWVTGNKGEVVRRFLDMDNETSVKLVFAIGLDGGLELARMVDQRIELQEPEGSDSTEPERVEPPPAEDYPVREIIGRPHVMPT